MKKTTKAIFFDRDGVLIEDSHLISKLEQVVINPQAPEILAYCNSHSYLCIVVTNQTVVSRGILNYSQAKDLNQNILNKIQNLNSEAIIKASYVCPHHPQAQISDYKKNCNCRKPKPGLLESAIQEHNIDPEKSFLVGDRLSDICAGNQLGIKSILLKSQRSQEKLIETDLKIQSEWLIPFAEIDQLSDLRKFI